MLILHGRLAFFRGEVVKQHPRMKMGFYYSSRRLPAHYNYKLRRQVVIEFAPELKQATGWRRDWIRWKRGIALEIRYNQLLFLGVGKSVRYTVKLHTQH